MGQSQPLRTRPTRRPKRSRERTPESPLIGGLRILREQAAAGASGGQSAPARAEANGCAPSRSRLVSPRVRLRRQSARRTGSLSRVTAPQPRVPAPHKRGQRGCALPALPITAQARTHAAATQVSDSLASADARAAARPPSPSAAQSGHERGHHTAGTAGWRQPVSRLSAGFARQHTRPTPGPPRLRCACEGAKRHKAGSSPSS